MKRLVALAAKKSEPDPQHLGMSSLLHIANIDPQDTDKGLVYKNLHALIGDFMDTFSIAVLTQVQRLNDAQVTVAIEFRRLFAPTLNVLDKLSPSWHGIQLVTEAQAQASNLRILGIQGEGLRNGLTATERAAITRKNYLYMNVTSPERQVIGSTSSRQVGQGLPNHGRGVIIAAPEDHPEVIKYSVWKHAAASKLDVAAQSPSLPLIAVACALYNVNAQVEMTSLQREAGDGLDRYRFGAASAYFDLVIASGNLSKFILGGEHQLVTLLNKPRLDVSRISGRWAINLAEQTGSPRLPILRALSGTAMLLTTAITAWDAKRAWHQGDRDAALAYGAAAAAGGAAWTAYALGMSINPVVLVAGAVLFIGGSILAGWLVDSDVEALLKNGPFGKDHGQTGILDKLFGDDQRFAHLSDPHIAYQQLIGILGRPMIQVSRLGDWLDQVPPGVRTGIGRINRQRAPVNAALECRHVSAQPFERDDWAVRIHSPLLGLFDVQHFQFYAREELAVLPLTGAFNAERTERRPIDEAKLTAHPLDNASVLYILPKHFPVMKLTPLQRHAQKVTQRLKVFGQFRLATELGQSSEMVLPQPSPKTWQPYQPAFAQPPTLSAQADAAPYWQIETMEFKV